MVKYGALISFLCLIIMVLFRAFTLKQKGIIVFKFAKTHKSDWILPPIVVFFIYHLFANVFDWPRLTGPIIFDSVIMQWFGLLSCTFAVVLFLWGILSFGTSFRVGIDNEHPSKLITTGAFRFTRNPLYAAFALELIGFFCIFQNLFFLIAMLCGFILFHRQIVREETFLLQEYKEEFQEYCKHVRRYF